MVDTIFMDDQHNIVPESDARWKVIHTYNDDGKLVEEVWVDLRK